MVKIYIFRESEQYDHDSACKIWTAALPRSLLVLFHIPPEQPIRHFETNHRICCNDKLHLSGSSVIEISINELNVAYLLQQSMTAFAGSAALDEYSHPPMFALQASGLPRLVVSGRALKVWQAGFGLRASPKLSWVSVVLAQMIYRPKNLMKGSPCFVSTLQEMHQSLAIEAPSSAHKACLRPEAKNALAQDSKNSKNRMAELALRFYIYDTEASTWCNFCILNLTSHDCLVCALLRISSSGRENQRTCKASQNLWTSTSLLGKPTTCRMQRQTSHACFQELCESLPSSLTVQHS